MKQMSWFEMEKKNEMILFIVKNDQMHKYLNLCFR